MQTATHRLPAPPRHFTPLQLQSLADKPPARRVTVALDAFPAWPAPRQMHGLSNSEYWEAKARDHITTLTAAHVLHKQVTTGITVPRALSYALNAMQIEIANRIKTSIRRHVSNGGKNEAELRQAWSDAA